MRLEKAFSEHFFELFERDQRFVVFAARGVYLREVFVHLNVQNGADIKRNLLSIADNRDEI